MMNDDDEKLPIKTCDHPMRVIARCLNEASLLFEHWSRVEDTIISFVKETDNSQARRLSSGFLKMVLSYTQSTLRFAMATCQPKVLQQDAVLIVELELCTSMGLTDLLYRDFTHWLNLTRQLSPEPWYDESPLDHMIGLLKEEQERLGDFAAAHQGFRSLPAVKLEWVSADDERMMSDNYVPRTGEERTSEPVLYLSREPSKELEYHPRIRGIDEMHRSAVERILETACLFFNCLESIEDSKVLSTSSTLDSVDMVDFHDVDAYGVKLSSALMTAHKSIDAICPLFVGAGSPTCSLPETFHQLLEDCLGVGLEFCSLIGNNHDPSSSGSHNINHVRRIVAKIQKIADHS